MSGSRPVAVMLNNLRDALPQGTVLQPNLENHEFYKTCYPIFRELYRANRESMYALQDNL